MCHFWAQNDPFVIKNFFCVQTIIIISSTYWPFSLCKILKKNTANPELWGCISFVPQMVHLPQTKIFFWKKILISFSSTYWPLSFCKILKKFLKFVEPIQIYLWCAIFRPKIPQFVLNKFFWYKPLLLLSSIYWSFSLGKI